MPDPRGVGPRDGREDPAVRVRTAKKLRNTGSMRKKGRKEKNMKLKKLLAIAMTAAMVMSMSAPAFAESTVPPTGVLGEDSGKGSISVSNPQEGETYSIYRLFELASFTDTDTASGVHNTDTESEAYSYVIDFNSGWKTFLTNYGPDGANSETPYAVLTTETDAAKKAAAYFIIEAEAITIKGPEGTNVTTYHAIQATENFSNQYDVSTDEYPYNTTDYTAAGVSVIQNFAQEALKYAAANNLTKATNVSGTAQDDITAAAEEDVAWANMPLGYYLVGTTMGTLVALDTNNPDVEVFEKNEIPTLEKKVLKKGSEAGSYEADSLVDVGTEGVWFEDTDGDIGDYVQFKTVIKAMQGAKGYTLHDVMETGLTFVNEKADTATNMYDDEGVLSDDKYDYTLKVYLVRKEGSGDSAANESYLIPASVTVGNDAKTNYELKNSGLNDGCDFEIEFKDADGEAAGNNKVIFYDADGNALDVKDNDKIVVTYWARINEDAHIYDDTESNGTETTVNDNSGDALDKQRYSDANTDKRNTNNTILTYGAHSSTTWEESTVTTYQLDVVKTKENNHLLEGAIFSLYKATKAESGDGDYEGYNKGANALVFNMKRVQGEDYDTYSYAGDAVTAPDTGNSQVNHLVSTEDGQIHVEGLEEGWYLLYEDTAPTGYNKLSHPILIYITGDKDNDGTTVNSSGSKEGYLDVTVTLNDGTSGTSSNIDPDAKITDSGLHTSDGVGIVNKTGTELPSTGGIGTTIFYVIGSILVVGAGLILVAKRRMSMN